MRLDSTCARTCPFLLQAYDHLTPVWQASVCSSCRIVNSSRQHTDPIRWIGIGNFGNLQTLKFRLFGSAVSTLKLSKEHRQGEDHRQRGEREEKITSNEEITGKEKSTSDEGTNNTRASPLAGRLLTGRLSCKCRRNAQIKQTERRCTMIAFLMF